ncbi:MAG: hypothetical protein LJE58_08395 [Thiogranum sp.]|jgi:hypothetical protein|nr:hypothetical protein [Thiogranum sp.]
MPQSRTAPQVGAPDPEASNSPIFDEDDDDYLSLDLELEASACYFNGQSYRIGDYVCSGTELLRCEEKGVWVREGDCRTD